MSRDTKKRFKMVKAGKQWLIVPITFLSLGAFAGGVHADSSNEQGAAGQTSAEVVNQMKNNQPGTATQPAAGVQAEQSAQDQNATNIANGQGNAGTPSASTIADQSAKDQSNTNMAKGQGSASQGNVAESDSNQTVDQAVIAAKAALAQAQQGATTLKANALTSYKASMAPYLAAVNTAMQQLMADTSANDAQTIAKDKAALDTATQTANTQSANFQKLLNANNATADQGVADAQTTLTNASNDVQGAADGQAAGIDAVLNGNQLGSNVLAGKSDKFVLAYNEAVAGANAGVQAAKTNTAASDATIIAGGPAFKPAYQAALEKTYADMGKADGTLAAEKGVSPLTTQELATKAPSYRTAYQDAFRQTSTAILAQTAEGIQQASSDITAGIAPMTDAQLAAKTPSFRDGYNKIMKPHLAEVAQADQLASKGQGQATQSSQATIDRDAATDEATSDALNNTNLGGDVLSGKSEAFVSAYNDAYKGAQDGIAAAEANKVLSEAELAAKTPAYRTAYKTAFAKTSSNILASSAKGIDQATKDFAAGKQASEQELATQDPAYRAAYNKQYGKLTAEKLANAGQGQATQNSQATIDRDAATDEATSDALNHTHLGSDVLSGKSEAFVNAYNDAYKGATDGILAAEKNQVLSEQELASKSPAYRTAYKNAFTKTSQNILKSTAAGIDQATKDFAAGKQMSEQELAAQDPAFRDAYNKQYGHLTAEKLAEAGQGKATEPDQSQLDADRQKAKDDAAKGNGGDTNKPSDNNESKGEGDGSTTDTKGSEAAGNKATNGSEVAGQNGAKVMPTAVAGSKTEAKSATANKAAALPATAADENAGAVLGLTLIATLGAGLLSFGLKRKHA